MNKDVRMGALIILVCSIELTYAAYRHQSNFIFGLLGILAGIGLIVFGGKYND